MLVFYRIFIKIDISRLHMNCFTKNLCKDVRSLVKMGKNLICSFPVRYQVFQCFHGKTYQ